MSVPDSLLVVAGLVMLGGFGVLLGALRMVGGGGLMVFGGFLRHGIGIEKPPIGAAATTGTGLICSVPH